MKEEPTFEDRIFEKVCEIVPAHLKKLCGLYRLALDQRRSSSAFADALWSKVDPELWFKWRNPWLILQIISRERLEKLVEDKEFMKIYELHLENYTKVCHSEGWFHETYPKANLKHLAYFSMEYGLSEALPIYSGGLGILAGDHLKTASDLDVPITGVGLLYQEGYFRQYIDSDGNQKQAYPHNDPGQLPILRARDKDGRRLYLEIELPGRILHLRVWHVHVGRINLYLLDSNSAVNTPLDRGITSTLYGGTTENRLQQEILLGMGGWKLLQLLGIKPEVCHLNEGHAAFAVLARAKSYAEENKISFENALTITRAGNIFTTHTPVSAGFDRFSPQLIEKYFSEFVKSVGIKIEDLLALGREHALDNEELFNMAYLAFRGSGAVNGVSKLHGEVSRKLFSPLFPRWPFDEVPVGYVTNGIHIPSWESSEADKLWSKACGEKRRWWLNLDSVENDFKKISDSEIWELRTTAKKHLINYLRMRFSYQKRIQSAPASEITQAESIFDPNMLTLGFARRFATYKRVNLLLHDKERLCRILKDSKRPVQLVLAGKAHPQDEAGKAMIKEWQEFIKQYDIKDRVIFLADYDILMAERLVHGVDVWINTPERPWEASGTSGMKLLANGGLNLSELDGWWAEAYTPDVGWSLGDGQEHNWEAGWELSETEALYETLEKQVIPLFYERDKNNQPKGWIEKIRNSMIKLAPQFSTVRMMHDYVSKYYLPAADAYTQRNDKHGTVGGELQDWYQKVHNQWKSTQFLDLSVKTRDKQKLFQVKVRLGELTPDDVTVELYANSQNGEGPTHVPMKLLEKLKGEKSVYLFETQVPAERHDSDFTPRLIPQHKGALIPAEAGEILWQH